MRLDFLMPSRSAPLLALLAVAAGTACTTGGSAPERILVVTIDTLRWDRLHFAGHDVETPNLDALAASGTRFTNAVTVVPLTLPAHASLFTGRYPPSHGVRANGIFRLTEDVETLAELYANQGFATGAFIGSFVLDRRFGLSQGFDHYDDELPEAHAIHTAYFAERPATEVVDRATRWIRARGDDPFFAWVHVFDPHAPYDPPSPFRERYADRPYDGEIAFTDHTLGPLFELMDEMEDALVVVTADHGESLGEHGESTHGLYIYDATTRIPLVMRGAGIPEGRVHEGRVRIVDIAPTLAELSGLELEAPLDGESLLSELSSDIAVSRDAYRESLLPRFSFNWSELRSLTRGDLKYIQAPQTELYDLASDPAEQTNLWGGPRSKEATTLAGELARIAASESAVTQPIDLDPETARRLESLGYLAANVAGASDDDVVRVDPKDRIDVYEHMQSLLSPDLTPEETIAGHRAILSIEPSNTLARNRLANTLSELGRFDEAIVEYRRLVRDSEIDFKGFENLAAALLLERRTEEALSTTEMAVASAPWNPDFHVLRGEALEQAQRLEDASRAYRRAAELEPTAENAWRLGAVLEKRGDDVEAESSFRRALESEPAFEPALAALARLLARTGRQDEAFEVLSGAASSPESSVAIATATAEAHLASGRLDEAQGMLERSRLQEPGNTRVLALLGAAYGRKGELDRAISVLEEAIEFGETSPDVRRNLAVILLRQGHPGRAVEQLELAVETAPDSAPLWFSLGNARFQAGTAAASVTAFERALALRGDWPEATFNLGMAAHQAGRRDTAIEAFRQFLEMAAPSDSRRIEEARRRLDALGVGP